MGKAQIEVKATTTIPITFFYSRAMYEAVEAYASDRTNRAKYDVILETVAATANQYLATFKPEPDWAGEVNESLKQGGNLWVGLTATSEVVINHPLLDVDKDGIGHIVFSAAQARNLARLLNKHADAAHTALTKEKK